MKRILKFIAFLIFLLVVLTYLYNKREKDLDIFPLKEFALNYQPCINDAQTNGRICDKLLTPPTDVMHVLNKGEITDEYKKYVLLVFLKLGVYQDKTYHNDFDVRESPFLLTRFKDKSTLVKAYCEILGTNFISRKLGPEFLSPYYAFDYLDSHPYLKKDSLIMDQVNQFNKIK